MALLHSSGGLVYHLRALRWRRGLWAPFHASVAAWLAAWQPDTRDLVLLGPSGGYALPGEFLARFRHIHVVEPDALARRILAWRFPDIVFDFLDPHALTTPGVIDDLAARYDEAALLFCNLLGQDLIGQPADFDRHHWLAGLEAALQDRSWASWHELASSTRPPARQAVSGAQRAVTLESALALFWLGGEIAIHDHETFGFCQDRPRQYALWQLLPQRWHLIEWLEGKGG